MFFFTFVFYFTIVCSLCSGEYKPELLSESFLERENARFLPVRPVTLLASLDNMKKPKDNHPYLFLLPTGLVVAYKLVYFISTIFKAIIII